MRRAWSCFPRCSHCCPQSRAGAGAGWLFPPACWCPKRWHHARRARGCHPSLVCGALWPCSAGMTPPRPTSHNTSPSQGSLCLCCCRWEEVTLKTGCPATPACSTTTSPFRHSPARSLTSAGSRTRSAVRQLCTLEIPLLGAWLGSPRRSRSSWGEVGALARLLLPCSSHRAASALSFLQRFDLYVLILPASFGCTMSLGPSLLGGGGL